MSVSLGPHFSDLSQAQTSQLDPWSTADHPKACSSPEEHLPDLPTASR